MNLRLVKIIVSSASEPKLLALLEAKRVRIISVQHLASEACEVEILIDLGDTEPVLDALEEEFGDSEVFRAVLIAVEATIPRPSEDPLVDGSEQDEAEAESAESSRSGASRVYREELHSTLSAATQWTRVYVATIVLSTVVAAVGLIQSSTAVIIGAMVIAPLLGPNMALALGTTLGDQALIFQALRTATGGLIVGLVLSMGIGLAAQPDLTVPEIASRMDVSLADIVLALASGAAGAIAFTSGAPAALIGVMVAVALMPPLVVLGMAAATFDPLQARGPALLLFTNVISVNLAAMVTFRVQGLNPRSWWENARARRFRIVATIVWTVLLGGIIGVIIWLQG